MSHPAPTALARQLVRDEIFDLALYRSLREIPAERSAAPSTS